jgi:hypothetical protein
MALIGRAKFPVKIAKNSLLAGNFARHRASCEGRVGFYLPRGGNIQPVAERSLQIRCKCSQRKIS